MKRYICNGCDKYFLYNPANEPPTKLCYYCKTSVSQDATQNIHINNIASSIEMSGIIDELVIQATSHFTKIVSTKEIIEKYKELYWGGNGVGDRFANKKFNYSVIYSKKQPSLYSENDDDKIPTDILNEFLKTIKERVLLVYSCIQEEQIYKKDRLVKTYTKKLPVCRVLFVGR